MIKTYTKGAAENKLSVSGELFCHQPRRENRAWPPLSKDLSNNGWWQKSRIKWVSYSSLTPKSQQSQIISLAVLMLTGLFLLANLPVRGQCDPSVLQVVDNERPVRFSVLIEEGKASLNDFIRVRSATGGEFEVKADALRDERTGKTIAANRITLTPTKFSIAKGDSEELGLEIAELEQTGLFTGQLFITNQADSCNIIIPLEVEVVADGQLSVLESDRNLEVRFVSPSWLNGLIPHKIRHQGLHFRIENTGDSPVEIEDFTLSLKGNSTKQVLSEKDFNWGDEKKVVAPQKIQTIRLPLANQMKIDADEYDGLLRLYFNGALKPMTLTVTLYTRIGVAGAILALLLGIAVGRMMKDVNKAQDQLEVMDRFIPLRARAEKLTDQPTKELLKTEMDEIEAKINKVTDAAGREALEERLNGLERKIIQLEHFFLLLSNTLERMKEEGIDRDRYNKEIHPKFVLLRTAILEGKEEESKKVLAELKNAITELYNESRDVLDKGSTSEVEAEMKKVMDSFTVVDAKTSTAPLSTGEKVEKWALRILNFIAGVKVTARVRYGLFRPLVSLATFLVIVLLGFQEIYVNGGDTFGVDGIYDYLKLFLWGVVSDVFSRTLIGNSSVDTFMAKPTQS